MFPLKTRSQNISIQINSLFEYDIEGQFNSYVENKIENGIFLEVKYKFTYICILHG